MIENTKNNISGAAIQWRTSPPPSEESCPRWQEVADTRVLTSPGWEMLEVGQTDFICIMKTIFLMM